MLILLIAFVEQKITQDWCVFTVVIRESPLTRRFTESFLETRPTQVRGVCLGKGCPKSHPLIYFLRVRSLQIPRVLGNSKRRIDRGFA